MGLHHFPIDIESTIESCHPEIYNNGSCVFKASDFTIAICEARKTKNLAALVPLIVNAVFSKHHIIIDIVAFIKKGEFPISRLATKQRARIVDAWVQGIIPIKVLYGINFGENSMIKLIKEIDEVARDDPVTGLKTQHNLITIILMTIFLVVMVLCLISTLRETLTMLRLLRAPSTSLFISPHFTKTRSTTAR